MKRLKLWSSSAKGLAAMRLAPQRPQSGFSPRRSLGTRFLVPQEGQTSCMALSLYPARRLCAMPLPAVLRLPDTIAPMRLRTSLLTLAAATSLPILAFAFLAAFFVIRQESENLSNAARLRNRATLTAV